MRDKISVRGMRCAATRIESARGYVHRNMGRVLLVALQAYRVAPGPARAELRSVVRADDEVVAAREREVLREGGRLADIVPA